MKRAIPLLIIALFLFGALSVPRMATGMHVSVEISRAEGLSEQQLMSALPAQFVDRPIRVAVYDEPDTTLPSYASGGVYSNNITTVIPILEGAGYSVTVIDLFDILDHELVTAKYDVLVLVDNLPRDNVTLLVKEFWRGGGAVLSFNSAFGYLIYFGLIHDSLQGNFGLYGVDPEPYWGYEDFNWIYFEERHPIVKDYHPGDNLSVSGDNWVNLNYLNLPGLLDDDFGGVAKSDVVDGVILGVDNSDKGGRIVQITGNCSTIPTGFESIITDSVDWLCPRPKGRVLFDDWLCPRPKGRVLFDYSHFPYYGIDAGDPTGFSGVGRYSIWRDYMVNHSFTVDKLYYSAEGNLTAETLGLYDMLVINTPEWNFTAVEVAAVTSWVEAGGGLFVMGEFNPGFTPENHNLNYLLTSFDLSLNVSDDYGAGLTTTASFMHPINEEVSEVHFQGGSFVNHSGSAYPIWIDGGNTLLGGQEYGIGRVLVSGDINCLGNYIEYSDNLHLSLSLANWLTSGGARVLMYADTWPGVANDNPYKGPVAAALRDLGVRFQLTYMRDYFNLSLHAYEWDLVIFDNLNFNPTNYLDDIYDYAQGNGRLIMSTWRYSSSTLEYLWNHLGFTKANNTYNDPIPFYLWEDQHPIFTSPVLIDTWNMSTPSLYPFSTDAANITALDNGTALAGYSTIPSKTNASIVLGPNGQFLTNSMLLTLYVNDTDDSTYPDCYELWMNEIAFMLRPFIDHPSNIQFEGGSTGHTITWHPTSWSPAEYIVVVDGETAQTGAWSGGSIAFNVDALLPGSHQVTLEVSDSVGSETEDSVTVLVEDTTLPTINSPANVTIAAGAAVSVTWTAYDLFPDSYRLFVNGTEELDEEWDGAAVAVNVENLEIGVHNLTMEVVDTSSNKASDTVMVTVTAGIAGLDPTTLLLIAGVGVVVLVIVILLLKKRGAGASK
jgi:hypothetical protein